MWAELSVSFVTRETGDKMLFNENFSLVTTSLTTALLKQACTLPDTSFP